MAYNWQLWLSARPTQRTKSVQNATVPSAGDAILYEFPVHNGLRAVRETHYLSNKTVRDGKSGPPLHIHLRQKETFEVEQGVLGIVKNGVEYAIRKEDGPVSVTPGVRHTFWTHATSQEDVVFKVWVEPQDLDHGFDESFMRNFSGYLRDCERDKLAPSLFQILLFLYDADIVLTPPFWLPLWFLVSLHHVLAYWVGAGLLGYKASYPEYSSLRK
ncbi:hypothetical protein M406DRAFT_323355 [Cryphonectria parasitica EP155]|uniref:Uncharacterized protein n=1 Tax=Cryphonectria parasitica (strain ATCC 38755 / EP155) TaxID=660469 RepID=A0A9P4XZZ2_CRYP1|nr:uncharacterized protein M406DRAFT_323355 [Cryphonectria parasitica EP155]KAF3763872.1 hypothetical protein M406DRAFT_323355 [Cryphonectria parasitica EP155]